MVHSSVPAAIRSIISILLLCNTAFQAVAQDSLAVEKDLLDVLSRKKIPNKVVLKDTNQTFFPSFLPFAGYNPAFGLVIGLAAGAGWQLGKPANTRLSALISNVNVTSKKQLFLNVRANLYFPKEKWIAQTDVRLMLYAQNTHGLGTRFGDVIPGQSGLPLEMATKGQPMRFNYIRLYETVYRKVNQWMYAGLGVHIDMHSNIKDELLVINNPGSNFITAHYDYSIEHRFSPTAYATNGFSLNLLLDTRDNSINTYSGFYGQLTTRFNTSWLGSSAPSSTVFAETRTFFKVNKRQHPSVLAFWSWGQWQTRGVIPYLALPSISWDTYNRSGRAYIQGRLRGNDIWYGETEYRMPVAQNGLIGAVAFFNVTSASDKGTKQPLFYTLAPGYGLGIRVKITKETRTNISVDYGFGKNGLSGLYFNLQETF